jgi:hypothetical protein
MQQASPEARGQYLPKGVSIDALKQTPIKFSSFALANAEGGCNA